MSMKRSKSAENLIGFTIPKKLELLSGERYKQKHPAQICYYSECTMGNLYVTNYRLYFQEIGHKRSLLSQNLDIPLGLISKIRTENNSKSQKDCLLEISCKDTRKFQFQMDSSTMKVFLEIFKQFTFPLTHEKKLFAFSYSQIFAEDGWNVYDPMIEFYRLGIYRNQNSKWRITKANENYELCDTYPSLLVIPNFKDKELSSMANFRSKNRLPVLSWISLKNGASLTRCSQPLNGISGHRSSEDERCLNIIRLACPQNDKLIIVDARPLKNAVANKAKGGGYESQNSYQNTEIVFLNIENIHAMRDSLRKLKEFCLMPPSEDKWLTCLENTLWLKHIKNILTGANIVADRISVGYSVLVHCSDGWDRTSQITSLAMLILDPYYRTIKGFEVLIEKEWLSFGHKFQQRYGHGDINCSDAERSPIFIQFIDCVYQISKQYRTEFEFNEDFLLTILKHLFSCRFGTFLCNSERERSLIKEKTVSLWSWINSSLCEYRNHLYQESELILKPIPSIRYIGLWKKYYYHLNPTILNSNPPVTPPFDLKKVQNQLKKKLDRVRSFKIVSNGNKVFMNIQKFKKSS